eukprot:6172128-Pleurochrysis_carterae.AAC.6
MAAGDAQSLADADPRYTLKLSIATEDQARLMYVMRAALESTRAVKAYTDAAREGVGPAGPTAASDREGVVLTPRGAHISTVVAADTFK